MEDAGVVFAAAALAALNDLPLECDGIARCLSQLLLREGIEHEIHVGALEVEGVGRIDLHCWVKLPGGQICDARAEMWLGGGRGVPHGVFEPHAGQRYLSRGVVQSEASPILFLILSDQSLEEFVVTIPSEAPMQMMSANRQR